jgi:predicted PurR-regulated permease PerM
MARLTKFISGLIVAVLIVAGIFYFRVQLTDFFSPFLSRLAFVVTREINSLTPPCQKSINYTLGNIDKRFNLSDQKLLQDLSQAGNAWSQAIGRQLFNYATTSGELKINFIYDYRQAAADKLKKLGIVVTGDRNSYDQLKAKYDALNQSYRQQRAALDAMISNFSQKQDAYNAEVASWNKRGGAPPAEVDRLNQTKQSLEAEVNQINYLTAQLNNLSENVNAAATVLNKLIADLNLNVQKYNNVGSSTGGEFEEGNYTSDASGQAINIYEFSGSNNLIRLLEHEFGHALGLGHTSSSGDVMYYLNQGTNLNLTTNDLAALKSYCGVK